MSPIFDMKCPSCEHIKKDAFVHKWNDIVKCLRCGAVMQRLFSCNKKSLGIKVFPSDGIFLEHVSAGGKRFYSEREMRDYEKKHDMTIARLH